MANRFFDPVLQATDNSGISVPGAKLYFYVSGTSTLQNTYSDDALTIANANPVIADGEGRFGDIFLLPADYKVVLKDADDVTLWSRDPYDGTLGFDTSGLTFGTVAELKAWDISNESDGRFAFLRGYYTNGDGGGGTFYYNKSSSETDNGGTVIAPDAGTGRWKRLVNGRDVTVKDFGAVGDGVTDDTTAFQNWATAIAGAAGYIPVPTVSYKITQSILFAEKTHVIGADKYTCLIDWYGAGAAFRTVGTVNVSGANRNYWSDFAIVVKGNASAQYGLAVLFGGGNILERIWIKWDGANRPKYSIITDQQALIKIVDCHFDGYEKFAILGPETGEFTDYGTTTSSYNTIAIIEHCHFNETATGATAVSFDRGEVVVIKHCNFNANPQFIRLGNITAFDISSNYFERTSSDFDSANNHGPALLLADTSSINGAALTVTNRTEGTFGPDNHIEIYQNSVASGALTDDGVIEIYGGFAGVLNVHRNQFAQPFSHCVLVRTGTATEINFEQNYFIRGSERTGVAQDVFVIDGATANINRATARQLNSIATEFSFGGGKILSAASIPDATGTSALLAETVSSGDLIIFTNGGRPMPVLTDGTFGAALSSTVSITSGQKKATFSGSNGNVQAGCIITIAGVTGNKTVKQVYNDGSNNVMVIDSAADATVSGAAVAFVAPTTARFEDDGIAAPSSGTYRVGDRRMNSSPSVGQPKGWMCTVAGTPGTWVSIGNL